MASPSDDLHDIPDPSPLLPGIEIPLWFWIAFVTFFFLALGLLLYVIFRRKSAAPTPEGVQPYTHARQALEELRDGLTEQSLGEVATASSLIMRRYLVDSLQEPALYETHEEFLLRPNALEELPSGARERLAPLLDDLAEAKYGPSPVDQEAARALVESSLEVLQGLESTRSRQIA